MAYKYFSKVIMEAPDDVRFQALMVDYSFTDNAGETQRGIAFYIPDNKARLRFLAASAKTDELAKRLRDMKNVGKLFGAFDSVVMIYRMFSRAYIGYRIEEDQLD